MTEQSSYGASDRDALQIENERLREERDYFIRHEKTARERAYNLERELRATYGELNKALGEHAPKAWDRIKQATRG